jgi:hypothetical protein
MNLWHTDTELEAQVEQAVRFTSAQPEGLRSLFSWTLHRHIAFDKADSIMPSSYYKTCAKYATKKNMECEPGNVTGAATVCNFPGPWWEHGTQFVKARFQQFAQKFHEAGGVVDNIVLDTEIGESLWEIGSLYTNIKEKDDCITARWRAIELDTRFPALLKRLVAAGFNLTNSTSPLVSTVANWRYSDNYQIWDSVVQQMVAEAWNATLAPFNTLYPKLQSWNYNFVHRRAGQETYGANTHPQGKYGGGSHVGTHQSEEHYFQMEPAAWNRTRINGSKHTYTATCFNAARMEVNKARASRLGAPRVPLAPWIASRAWASNTSAATHRNQCCNNDFYSEVIFHYLAIGVGVFNLWNPSEFGTADRNSLFAATLAEGTQALRDALAVPPAYASDDDHNNANNNLVNNNLVEIELVDWDAQHVTTTVATAATSSRQCLSRFSPRLLAGETPETLLHAIAGGISSSSNELIFRLHCFATNSTAPVDLPLADCTVDLTFPDGEIIRNPNGVSAAGLWITSSQPPSLRASAARMPIAAAATAVVHLSPADHV